MVFLFPSKMAENDCNGIYKAYTSMKFFIVKPSSLHNLIALRPKYSPQDSVFKYS